MSSTISKKSPKTERAQDVGVSFYGSLLRDIDEIRGDTNRSLWIRRAALRELERQKNEKQHRK
jgi:metal-responsive CopG/Arc/MetJ family transcriptional regulator